MDGILGWYAPLPRLILQCSSASVGNVRDQLLTYAVFSHDHTHHLPNHDPPIPSNPKIRKPICNGDSRWPILPPLAIRLRRTSQLQFIKRLRRWLRPQQSCRRPRRLHLVCSPLSFPSSPAHILTATQQAHVRLHNFHVSLRRLLLQTRRLSSRRLARPHKCANDRSRQRRFLHCPPWRRIRSRTR